MKFLFYIFILLNFNCLFGFEITKKSHTILIAVLVRNKAHTLPYFLTLLEKQNYDKRRLSLFIVSDHNVDNSVSILKLWINSVKDHYHSIDEETGEVATKFADEEGPGHWSTQRFAHIIKLRERALDKARKMWADFILFLDADAFLTNAETLSILINQSRSVVAPMLRSSGLYSNFWCGMTEGYYYMRTDDYKPILKGERKGCFNVPMIHSAVLVNLRETQSDLLTFVGENIKGYNGPVDDIITFAVGANISGIPLHICNDETYGYVTVPMEQQDSLEFDQQQLINLKLEVLTDGPPLPVSPVLSRFISKIPKNRLGLDEIYVVNLRRRPERRERMENCFDELGLDVTFVDAVDGRELDDDKLEDLGVRFMPEYRDPYHNRPMTRGEIGCFLSHYRIWQSVLKTGREKVMVLEDDIRFEPFFRRKVENLLSEIEKLNLDWDLIYLGRKRLKEDEEWVEESQSLVHVTYSYWTLGYLLTQRGARRLLATDVLSKLLPVDEYIPIMFDRHPEESWKAHFTSRNLAAFSAAPLLLFPTHYTGESGYISDTENSTIIGSSVYRKINDDL